MRMDTSRPEPRVFRRQLDDILRQHNPAALRRFLIAQGQWSEDTRTDAEAAMWMMIAASPALAAQRGEAERWLMTHGHEIEARAILGGEPGSAAMHQAGGEAPRAPARNAGGGSPKPPHHA